jgi:putative acetyltransferase
MSVYAYRIRAEKAEDIVGVHRVNVATFGRENEADLVDRLRGGSSTLSFVAVESEQVESEQIVGHVFFSPVAIAGRCANQLLLGLAPVAVLPAYQRQGIGSLLIRHGLKACAQLGCKAVVVLGSPAYYPRFGFIPAKQKGLTCEYPVPDEAFMVLELEPNTLQGCVSTVKYHAEFDELE